MTKTRLLASVMLVSLMIVGCSSESERVAQIATEAADRQAQQNQEMARVNTHVAEGTKRLVEADAESRRAFVEVHQGLQDERSELNGQWTSLEMERQEIAQQRRTQSMLVPIAQAVGVVLLATMVIGFCWSLLFGLQRSDTSDAQLAELLIHDVISDQPFLLPPSVGRQAISDQREAGVAGTDRLSDNSNPEEDVT